MKVNVNIPDPILSTLLPSLVVICVGVLTTQTFKKSNEVLKTELMTNIKDSNEALKTELITNIKEVEESNISSKTQLMKKLDQTDVVLKESVVKIDTVNTKLNTLEVQFKGGSLAVVILSGLITLVFQVVDFSNIRLK